MGARVSILGASGYSGGELLRLVAGHPALEAGPLGAGGRAGDEVAAVHPHLAGIPLERMAPLEEVVSSEVDVCFSCLPSGELRARASALRAGVVVDLSDDFRAEEGWVYGLTEWARGDLGAARLIANPGCYPTATLLALVPFAAAGAIGSPVVVDALSGVSGAGRRPGDRLLFPGLDASAAAYGTTDHRHVPEMERGLRAFGGLDASVSFTPHLVPMARGLLATARAPLTGSLDDAGALDILSDRYEREPFVDVVPEWPATKAVSGSNRALVHARVDARNDLLVASTAIDNLGKGAAGQAIQNANLAMGLDEATGLSALGVWP